VLFSNDQVAQFINAAFEPVWESVRPVPIVRIDFGNGTVLTRTLHGNIATYACTADGQVLDVLPGIYAPKTYLERLREFQLLARYADQNGKEKREAVLKDYHEKQADALKNNGVAGNLVRTAGVSKAAIENKIKLVIGISTENFASQVDMPKASKPVVLPKASKPVDEKPNLESPDDVANWKTLAEDTKLNETGRRQQIHEMLAKSGLVKPDKVMKPIYKDVLHADLDDPYLGLGEALFASYPFAKEDSAR
jgi:hypothetical protein